MQINIENLEVEISSYNKLIVKYKEIQFDFYNKLKLSKEYWVGNDANYFFSNIDAENIKVQLFFDELLEIEDIYKFLFKRYRKFGKKIFVILSQKDNIIIKFNNYLDYLNDLINIYNNLDIEFDRKFKMLFLKQEQLLENNRKLIISLKEKYKKYFNDIEDIEKQIKENISKINLKLIRENNIKVKTLGSYTNPYINSSQLYNNLNLLKIYKNDESINIEEINEINQNILCNYNGTENKNLMKNIMFELIRKFKIINCNHNNELIMIENKIKNHKNTVDSVVDIANKSINKIEKETN